MRNSRFYPIPDFPRYRINRMGEVWSEKSGKVLRPGIHNGYLQVVLYKDGNPYYKKIHRLILETFIGPCPDGVECCHNNGIKTDNRLENLRWDTQASKDVIGFIKKWGHIK